MTDQAYIAMAGERQSDIEALINTDFSRYKFKNMLSTLRPCTFDGYDMARLLSNNSRAIKHWLPQPFEWQTHSETTMHKAKRPFLYIVIPRQRVEVKMTIKSFTAKSSKWLQYDLAMDPCQIASTNVACATCWDSLTIYPIVQNWHFLLTDPAESLYWATYSLPLNGYWCSTHWTTSGELCRNLEVVHRHDGHSPQRTHRPRQWLGDYSSRICGRRFTEMLLSIIRWSTETFESTGWSIGGRCVYWTKSTRVTRVIED